MNPRTLPEIRSALAEQHEQLTTYLQALPLEVFFQALQDTWSPLQHMQHLLAAEVAFGAGLSARRFKRLETPTGSRSYAEVVLAYNAALKAAPDGALQNNPFPPPPYGQLDALETTRGLALSEWRSSGNALAKALSGYDETELDALSGRHPLMGAITLREFLFFMIYHIPHHQAVIERRLAL